MKTARKRKEVVSHIKAYLFWAKERKKEQKRLIKKQGEEEEFLEEEGCLSQNYNFKTISRYSDKSHSPSNEPTIMKTNRRDFQVDNSSMKTSKSTYLNRPQSAYIKVPHNTKTQNFFERPESLKKKKRTKPKTQKAKKTKKKKLLLQK